MMKTRLIQWILSLWILCLAYSLVNAATEDYSNGICAKEANLGCLQSNFDKLYGENDKLFWKILRDAADKYQACNSIEDTVAFLELAIVKQGNAEFAEFFSETIEQLCVQESSCFLDGLLRVNKLTKIALLNYLRTPLFADSSVIDSVFVKAKQNRKYEEISDIYFSK